MIIKVEKLNIFEHKMSKNYSSIIYSLFCFFFCRNFKEDIQRLQREKDELSLKNENIHDEMTPRYDFFF